MKKNDDPKHDEIEEKPVYMISIAAKLTGLHPQTLRIYERKELLTPGRTPKSTRLYSKKDIDRLKHIQKLTNEEGVNLAGVKMIMELQNRLDDIQRSLTDMEEQIASAQRRLSEETSRFTRHYRRELVVVPKGALMKRK